MLVASKSRRAMPSKKDLSAVCQYRREGSIGDIRNEKGRPLRRSNVFPRIGQSFNPKLLQYNQMSVPVHPIALTLSAQSA
jgi:hypothetical protein